LLIEYSQLRRVASVNQQNSQNELSNADLERRKTEAEVRKLELENERTELELTRLRNEIRDSNGIDPQPNMN
jgi:hypothetical protein